MQTATLFESACHLAGTKVDFQSELESLDRNLRFALPRVRDLTPLSRRLQHRSLGWINGSAGIALGEHSPIGLRTPGGNGLVAFYAPFTGHLRVNQNGQVLDTLKTPGWLLLVDQESLTQTGDNLSCTFLLSPERLRDTANAMQGTPKDAPSAIGAHSVVINMKTPVGQRAQVALPALLHYLIYVRQVCPQLTESAEESIYRFVASLLIDERALSLRSLNAINAKRSLDTACGFMIANIDRTVTLTQIERTAALSSRSLHSLFKTHTQYSPLAWLKEQRLQLAYHLIKAGGPGMVSEAATACGLTHFGRFSQDFKLRFGLLPSEVHSGRTHQGGESQFRAETQATAAAVQH